MVKFNLPSEKKNAEEICGNKITDECRREEETKGQIKIPRQTHPCKTLTPIKPTLVKLINKNRPAGEVSAAKFTLDASQKWGNPTHKANHLAVE